MEVFTVNETLLACYSQVLEGAFCWSNTCTRAHFFGGDWLQLNSKATRLMQSRSAVPPSSHDLTDRRANSLWGHGRAGGRQASDWLDRRSNRKRNGHLYDSSYFLPIFSVFILAMIRGRGGNIKQTHTCCSHSTTNLASRLSIHAHVVMVFRLSVCHLVLAQRQKRHWCWGTQSFLCFICATSWCVRACRRVHA